MQRVHYAELAGGLSFMKHLRETAKERSEVAVYDVSQMSGFTAPRSHHHFTLHDRGVQGMAGDVVKVRARISQDFVARRKVFRQGLTHAGDQASENMVEDRSVEGLFIFEIVVEQGFIHFSSPGDGVGTGSGDSFTSEFENCGL